MSSWYHPIDIKTWFRRLLVPRSLILGLLLLAIAVTELRLDWIESMVGAYLVKTNHGRPESGAIWDQGRNSSQARQTLESYMHQKRSAQAEARGAVSLGQLVTAVEGTGNAMLSAEHFIELYMKLPPVLSHELISPFTMLSYVSGGRWQRTYFEYQEPQLLVYLLDGENQVLHRLSISPGLLALIQRGEVAITAGLDQLADFAGHIYAAERFFNTLNSFPAAVRQTIIAHPEDLLRVSGRLMRVGIAAASMGDTVDLGFEIQAADGLKVILMQGAAGEVRALQRVLEGGRFEERPSPGRWPFYREGQ
jgi:hypothetical protein